MVMYYINNVITRLDFKTAYHAFEQCFKIKPKLCSAIEIMLVVNVKFNGILMILSLIVSFIYIMHFILLNKSHLYWLKPIVITVHEITTKSVWTHVS